MGINRIVVGTDGSETADKAASKGIEPAGLSRFLLGSVSNKVSHHAPCDVLIVRTED